LRITPPRVEHRGAAQHGARPAVHVAVDDGEPLALVLLGFVCGAAGLSFATGGILSENRNGERRHGQSARRAREHRGELHWRTSP
jgi:hypothetical protein